jgi:hypothetical protein
VRIGIFGEMEPVGGGGGCNVGVCSKEGRLDSEKLAALNSGRENGDGWTGAGGDGCRGGGWFR